MKELDEIRNCLIEMKNISSLMIDLALSSVMYNSEEIAEEVYLLEEKVDELTLKVKKLALKAAKQLEDPESMLSVIEMANINEQISDSAYEIADIVLRDVEPHPIIRKIMHDVEEEIGRVTVHSGSILIGKKLKELKLPSKIGVRLIAIKRGNKYIYNPSSDEVIKEGDILIAVGAGIDKLRELSKAEEDEEGEELD
ncbi:potassium channel protein [Pyrococcus furiosus DSM 3638]|uniref:Potassium channel protein n=3 Tax=Pyrococcus furiosus TaxID=2261 RepID=A0A5C0XLR1_PYRFU|nr:potassium channel family protein [Pyrococcus furiosus]AAL80270.1 potassium channel, putative [Pyrococcus furiosus DSM 3638]AFN04430.1 potassium channel [Pyrococcus furiosus COM1]QEK77876.1 potassium channel protein [Pyrococcus furiosus DSM 3638]